jgi:hypothetical protein
MENAARFPHLHTPDGAANLNGFGSYLLLTLIENWLVTYPSGKFVMAYEPGHRDPITFIRGTPIYRRKLRVSGERSGVSATSKPRKDRLHAEHCSELELSIILAAALNLTKGLPDCTGEVAVVLKGIIKNCFTLKKKVIEEGHKFSPRRQTQKSSTVLSRSS